MKVVIDHDPATGMTRIGVDGVEDRATVLDLIEYARQVIHQQGQKDRQKMIQAAPASLLSRLPQPN